MKPSALTAVILCGGRGTRLAEANDRLPKPLVEVGGEPILMHIMRHYAAHGCDKFALCLGYRGEMIKDYFLQYHWRTSSFRVRLGSPPEPLESRNVPAWQVDCVDTGLDAMTGARIKRMEKYLEGDLFFLTYGDGVSDVPLDTLLEFHLAHGRACTVTGVHPQSRFGELEILSDQVVRFTEKPQINEGFINGGFFVFDRRLFGYLQEDDACRLEGEPLERLAADGQLAVYRHGGFWHCLDTPRDLQQLNDWAATGRPPWKVAK